MYDALNRLTHKGYPDATGVDYVYDLAGKIKQVTDPTGTYGMAYDNMGRLIGTTTQYSFLPGHTYTNAYTYDATSNRTGFTAPDGSTNTYAYDTLNRLTTLTDSGAGQFTFGYDGLSRRTQLSKPNGIASTYAYDPLSRLQSILHKLGANTVDGATYTYDNAGNRTSKTNQLNSAVSNFSYGNIYQLTGVTGATSESYTYDAVGNRLSSASVSGYTYNSSNELTGVGSATYIYDNNGNVLTETSSTGTTTYVWDFENRLTSVQQPSPTTVTFKYDPFGRRIQKAGSVYLYDVANLIVETDSSGNPVARYVFGPGIDEPVAAYRGTWEFYQVDALGSVTSLSTTAGVVGDSFVYDTFGNTNSSTGTFIQPFRYTGREYDSETGLYFYRARYYSPETGRFISEDPLRFYGGGANFYRYVNNNSVNFTDPFGYGIGWGYHCLMFRYYYGQCAKSGLGCKARLQSEAPQAVNPQDPGNGDLLGQLANARNGQGTPYEGCMNLSECMAKEPACIKMAEYAVKCGGFAIESAGSFMPILRPLMKKLLSQAQK